MGVMAQYGFLPENVLRHHPLLLFDNYLFIPIVPVARFRFVMCAGKA